MSQRATCNQLPFGAPLADTEDLKRVEDGQGPQNEGRKAAWAIGSAALVAWFLVLWLMFGDVL